MKNIYLRLLLFLAGILPETLCAQLILPPNSGTVPVASGTTINAPNGPGIQATGPGTRVLLGSGVTVITNISPSVGNLAVSTTEGGSIIAHDGGLNIITFGVGGRGVSGNFASEFGNHGGTISIGGNNNKITTEGSDAMALCTFNLFGDNFGGNVSANNITIETFGDSSYGVAAGPGEITLSGVNSITTHGGPLALESGNSAHGVFSAYLAPINILGQLTVTTTGPGAMGFNASTEGLIFTQDAQQVLINTSGAGAAGIRSNRDSNVVTGVVHIKTTGAPDPNLTLQSQNPTTAMGIIILRGSTVTLGGGDITVQNGSGVAVSGGSIFNQGSTVINAPNGTGIISLITDPEFTGTNTIAINGGSINAGGDAIDLEQEPTDITVTGVNNTWHAGSGNLINSVGSTGTFNIENSTLTGNILADSASTLDVNLSDNSILTGLIEGAHNVSIDPSTWIMPNDSFVTGNLTNQGSIIISSAAKFASIGQASVLTIGGNFTMTQGATLSIGIGGLLGKQYDHLLVGGNAHNLAGELVVNPLNFHPSAGNAFEVLHANGTVSGNFSLNDSTFNTTPGVITGHLELRPMEVITKNAVFLVYVAPPPGEEPPTNEQEPEQPPVVDEPGITLPPVNPEEPVPEKEVVLLLDPTAEELTSLYEIGFSAANMQRFNLGDRMFQIQQSVVPPPPVPPIPTPTLEKGAEGKGVEGKAPPPAPLPSPINRWGVWANGWGDFVNVDSTSTAQGYRFTTGGVSAGVDYLVIPNHFAVGLFGGYSHSWINFTPSGSAETDTGRGGLYATYFDQGWWVDAAVWGGGTDYSTSRQAVAGTANGSTNGWEFSTFGEAGYDIHCGALAFGPTVAMQFTRVFLNGFGENGSLVPLDIHGAGQNSLRTDVGGRVYYKWLVGNIPVIPTVNLGWEHEYKYSTLDIGASAPALGASTTFSGPNIGHDSLIINAGISVQWTPRIWTTIGYDGNVARDHYNSNAVSGTFSFSF